MRLSRRIAIAYDGTKEVPCRNCGAAMKRTLEQRVAALERQVKNLQDQQSDGPGKDDWRRTIGMFTENPGMMEIFDEAMKIREADRKKTRPRS
jgi:hypothetical protein